MNPDQPILVLSRKKPHLILFMVLVIMSGLLAVTEGSSGGDLPDWLTRTWGALLIFSGSVALVAHVQRLDRERGMLVERGALIMQAGAVMAYGLAVPSYLGWTMPMVVTLLAALSWAAANFWEVYLIGADLKLIYATRRLSSRRYDASDG